jgi:hypothetical protein
MNEPSILDYIKSIFKSGNSFSNFVKAIFERRDTTQLVEVPAAQPAGSEAAPAASSESGPPSVGLKGFPWRTLLVLVLALAGQKLFEPPQQLYVVGIVFYISALGLLLLAFREGEWKLTPIPPDEARIDTFSIRALPFFLSLLLSAAAFFTMSGNRFTGINLTLLAGAFFFHLRAFLLPGEARQWSFSLPALPRWNLSEFLTRDEWTLRFGARRERAIRITRWGILIFLVVVVSIFFRTYRLDTVAPEMTSDHAEKLLDVYDITQGQYSIYFPRNTGREPLYIYLCALFSQWFGLSFLTLKIVAVIGGLLTLPYIYLLGKEMGSARLGLLAAAFAGFGYWPTVIERFGLRISFYPLFAAATLYYFFRGMRRQQRNDFIYAGIALGLGLNGYTPFRIMPFVLIALFLVYFLHLKDNQTRKQVVVWFGLMALTSWIFFIPMARFWMENPAAFGERSFSRLLTTERPFPGPVWQLFLYNLWNALKQFNWYNGSIWVHSVPSRPALDVISGALFLIGVTLVLVRYLRNRHWKDILLLLSVPLLQMPSILSLAFPDENPGLNRTGAALVPVFLLVGFGLDSLLNSMLHQRTLESTRSEPVFLPAGARPSLAVGLLTLGLFAASFSQNYDLIFNQYYKQYRNSSWNSREMGTVIRDFIDEGGLYQNAWMVPYPFWVDTRLQAFWAGLTPREMAIAPDRLADSLAGTGAKLFIFAKEDQATAQTLQQLYPDGVLTMFRSAVQYHDFYVFRVPAE